MELNKRYDFVLFFDVKDGNPNGDPDAGNLPRVDAETGHGLITDVCLKRKIRNYVGLIKNEKPPYEIYVKEKAVLNNQHRRAYIANDIIPESKKLPKEDKKALEITKWMCKNFYDIRTFGAVMSTEVNAGQVRGPIQFVFSRSVEPIVSLEHSITRMAVTNEKDIDKERTMGRKFTIPYGLYRTHGFISAPLANQTGFSQDDLSLFWEAIENMFEHDRSAARGMMSSRRLIIFEHSSAMGNKPAQELFDRVTTKRITDGPARDFSDYSIELDGMELKEFKKIISV